MFEPTPFRFLDLPKELRFMIYESLFITTKHHHLLPLATAARIGQTEQQPLKNQPSITLTLHTLPVQILSTCHLVHAEALPFLSRKLDTIKDTIPKITVDAECLHPPMMSIVQDLLRSILNKLDHHSFFTSTVVSPSPIINLTSDTQYSEAIHQCIVQKTTLLLSQPPTICPLAGFMGIRSYPTVRLVLEVSKLWRYTTSGRLQLGVPARSELSGSPAYTSSVATQLSQVYSELADYAKGLKHVRGGGIVFRQEDERVVMRDGLLVKKICALDFGISRCV
jgi:hypothetical protein